jgi:kynureninase
MAGNSLGLQPKSTRAAIEQELEAWARWGVEGHVKAKDPWMPYHELMTPMLARVVGAEPDEVVAMNSLTVNLHLLMASFYRPTKDRHQILIEASSFSSDRYAVESQIRFHGFDPATSLIEVGPKPGESLINDDDLESRIKICGSKLALVLVGNVNYLSGQKFKMKAITQAAHSVGANVGFDLAHGAGNLDLQLSQTGCDFAAWCSYKYLNAGPGAIAGVFVNKRHHHKGWTIPRFAGWWGHNKETRFLMKPNFDPIDGAEGWQLSNPPILQLAALRSSLEIFDRVGIERLAKKAAALTRELQAQLKGVKGLDLVSSPNADQRGAQLSYRVAGSPSQLSQRLYSEGVMADHREPDIIRFSCPPLYTRFVDVFDVAQAVRQSVEAL